MAAPRPPQLPLPLALWMHSPLYQLEHSWGTVQLALAGHQLTTRVGGPKATEGVTPPTNLECSVPKVTSN